MTTSITVKTHNWPVLVKSYNKNLEPWTEDNVCSHSERTFYIHSDLVLQFIELPEEK